MKTSLLAVLLLMAATPAFADPPPGEDVLRPKVGPRSAFYWQIDAGLNGTLLDGNPYIRPLMSFEQENAIFKSGIGFAPLVSLSLGYDISPHFSLELRADYDPRNASNSSSVNDTCFLTDPISGNRVGMPMAVDKSYSLNATYLSLSLLPAYRFENLFIFAGPTVSIPLIRSLKETDAIVGVTPCYYLAGSADSTKTVVAQNTDKGNAATRVSLKLGVGYVFELTPTIEFVPRVGLDLALNDLLTADETLMLKNPDRPASTNSLDVPVNRHIRLNSLQATVGLRFHF
ncbi:MAG: hypothetical protein JWQ98_1007 [Chlorobi bacterium]|nr:hypothetical protein [Chlorobiota bacterium]